MLPTGIGVRTSASLAQENSGTVNVDGSGIGLAFQTTTGDQIENDLDMSQSSGLVVNLNGTGGTGILANTRDGATVKSGASVNINKADGGSALVVNNFAKRGDPERKSDFIINDCCSGTGGEGK
ncbi:hypothetical protein [Budvicia aquatica]|uniref:Uncharacterized protein n=1 Tax=Budvicia aquatica TaxID=82979 RepID=A0A484ZC70_9GAMM|nr:hypothetical protein [Budvicia aquatica]VFS45984.1 Uncharacterised protein [Budvicia aquatica]